MIKQILFLPAAILILLLGSCSFEDVEVGNIQGVTLVSVNKESIDIEVSIPVKNLNKMGFTISKVDIQLALNGVEYGKVTQAKKIKVKPQSCEVYPILFHVKLNESVTGLPKLIAKAMMGKKIDMKAQGYVKGRKFIFSKKFVINENTPVNFFDKKK